MNIRRQIFGLYSMFDDLNKQMIVFLLSIKKICRCGMITNEIICFQKFYNDFEVQKPVDKHRI